MAVSKFGNESAIIPLNERIFIFVSPHLKKKFAKLFSEFRRIFCICVC